MTIKYLTLIIGKDLKYKQLKLTADKYIMNTNLLINELQFDNADRIIYTNPIFAKSKYRMLLYAGLANYSKYKILLDIYISDKPVLFKKIMFMKKDVTINVDPVSYSENNDIQNIYTVSSNNICTKISK